MENIHVSEPECKFTCREKTFPDGSYEILICDRPLFSERGWEYEKNSPKIRRERHTSPASPENLARSARRASTKLRDIALCNNFQTFVTLTLDQAKIDRYDRETIVKKLQTWADNHVRRDGLRYVLVPELHKDGALHFHGFFGWACSDVKDKWLVDSGTVSVPGKKAPVKPRSEAHRKRLIAVGAQTVYNLPKWPYGFTTAIPLYGDYHAAVSYVCKYVRKQIDCSGEAGGKICKRWYFHGGCDGQPLVRLSNQAIRDFEGYPGAYRFDVPEAGLSFVRILGKDEEDENHCWEVPHV